MKTDSRYTLLGYAALIPAFLIVFTGLMQGVFGITAPNVMLDNMFGQFHKLRLIIHPAFVIGGLLIAIGINLLSVFKISFTPQAGALITTITTQWKKANITALCVSLFLLSSILLYAIGENFRIVVR